MKDHGRSDLPGDTPKKRSGFLLHVFFNLIKMTESAKKTVHGLQFWTGSGRFTFPLPETAQPFPGNI